jgi:hypothetical protein
MDEHRPQTTGKATNAADGAAAKATPDQSKGKTSEPHGKAGDMLAR